MSTQSNKDAIDLLTKEHKEAKALFSQFERLTDRSKASKKKIADEVCEALLLHTELEEEIFYPAVRKAIADDDLMDEALVEHAAAKELITEIQQMDPDDELYDARVKVLSEQIEHHVQEEEGDMFTQVRKTNLDLVKLGKEMESYKDNLQTA